MKVGIIGSGGREHALCLSLKKSNKINEIFCFPGNGGTSSIAKNIDIEIDNFHKLIKKIKKIGIDIVVIGPEKPLVNGLTEFLKKNKIKVFGPNKLASKLEGSKIFTKKLCKKYNIPTANFGIFRNVTQCQNFLKNSKYPIVVKADGLASGKGVYICENFEQSLKAVKEIFAGKFGIAKEILIEEFLNGEEMSFFIVSDGKSFKKFGTAQDHKRLLEGDKGKNTGGMGAYSPSRLDSKKLDEKILKKIIKPTIKGLRELNSNFVGFLYAGLMIVNDEPFLIEYNVRMGDPECQTILPRLKTDLAEVILACVNKKLASLNLKWSKEKSLCVVLTSKGYPDQFKKNVKIDNLEKLKLKKNNYVFHAGTKLSKGKIFSNGGRVLNFVSISGNLKKARLDALKLIKKVNWKNGFFRGDIGHKAII